MAPEDRLADEDFPVAVLERGKGRRRDRLPGSHLPVERAEELLEAVRVALDVAARIARRRTGVVSAVDVLIPDVPTIRVLGTGGVEEFSVDMTAGTAERIPV